jgi:tetratricopeptide (TPR) repeat protein
MRITAHGIGCNSRRLPGGHDIMRIAHWPSLGLLLVANTVFANPCGPLENHYGPFDYRYRRDALVRVEQYHFTPQVEALIRGQSTVVAYGYAGDISYLMGTSPNHHRGLMAIMKLVERDKNPQPPRLRYSIDCYFERATRFAPDDVVVRMLFARHLAKQGKTDEAVQQLKVAELHANDNALTHFNLGLAYEELDRLEPARDHAHKAMALGMERTELADRLRKKGAWREPAAPPTAPSASAAASGPATRP